MDVTQILNNIVLGLHRLGDFVKGWESVRSIFDYLTGEKTNPFAWLEGLSSAVKPEEAPAPAAE